MKKKMIVGAMAGAMLLGSCQQSVKPSANEQRDANEKNMPANISGCDIRLGNMTFTHALNGGDSCIKVEEQGKLVFKCTEKRDIFCDPNGKLTNNTVPMLLSAVDNTKPFTLTAKVTPGFTAEGQYNAADLFVYANDTIWQKLCYEQDERGNHRIVTVRTFGTSDDNNHQKLDEPSVYLRFSSDTRTLASYYSHDKKTWHMVRLYKNYYPTQIWVGIASQCPTKGVCTSVFEDVSLEQSSVGDFRTGD